MSVNQFQIVYALAASNATALINAAASGTTLFTLLGTAVGAAATTSLSGFHQQKLIITATGNESANVFTIVGNNETGVQIIDTVTGPNNSTALSNLDFATVSSFTARSVTAGTTSLGPFNQGSCPWYIVNLGVTPVNLGIGIILQSGAATSNLQYTYDDPNNLPPGVTLPTTFNHTTFLNGTATLDGFIRDPIYAARLNISGGTGVVRLDINQAGISQGG